MPLPQSLLVTLIVPRVLSLLSWKTEGIIQGEMVGDITHRLNTRRSTGPDRINPRVLKELAEGSPRHLQTQKAHEEETYMEDMSKRRVYEGLESSFFS